MSDAKHKVLNYIDGSWRHFKATEYLDILNPATAEVLAQRKSLDLCTYEVAQMLAVARGLMAQPEILMCDELSLGLAPFLVLKFFEILQKLKAEGLTILLVEQSIQMALAISDYAYVLADGRIELEGPSREVAKNEHVRQAYLGI